MYKIYVSNSQLSPINADQCDRQTEGWNCLDVEVGMVGGVGIGIVGVVGGV